MVEIRPNLEHLSCDAAEGTHLALNFYQKSKAAKDSHTDGIAQGHIFRHLLREMPKNQTNSGIPRRNKSQGPRQAQAHLQAECEHL